MDGKILTGWTTCLTNNWIPNYQISSQFIFDSKDLIHSRNKNIDIDYNIPTVYYGSFTAENQYYDTFLKMDKFTKVINIFIIFCIHDMFKVLIFKIRV